MLRYYIYTYYDYIYWTHVTYTWMEEKINVRCDTMYRCLNVCKPRTTMQFTAIEYIANIDLNHKDHP